MTFRDSDKIKNEGSKIDNFVIHNFSTCITVHLIYSLDT